MQEMNSKFEYSISDKKGGNSDRYSILSIDVQIKRISDDKLVILSHRNLYRMKKNDMSAMLTNNSDIRKNVYRLRQ
jgi:hypothetical protein